MNPLGLSTSYDAVERIDTAQVQHTIAMAGSYRVPTPPSIVPHELVHGVMGNFDNKKKTQFLATTLSSCYLKTLKIPNSATKSCR